MIDESPYVMTPMEIVMGYLFGHAGILPPPIEPTSDTRRVLEDVVREALLRPPCGIAFSGGRDSSALLAIALHVARRDGLPEPVAVTKVFPNAPESEEGEWQETVVRHLGLREWQRIVITDELDLVGPLVTSQLIRHGILWPPTIHGDLPMIEHLAGGVLLDGEGGDEVLGVTSHRIAPLSRLVRSPRPLRWRRLRSALGAVAPGRVRAAHALTRFDGLRITWLRPAAREALEGEFARLERERPLSFAASVRLIPTRRTQAALRRNRRVLARDRGVEVSSPFLHADVVHALARDGGSLGRVDRTTALRALVPDLLPDAVLSRTSKARFNGVIMARHTREFGERWTGEGVDPNLVDPDELARLWRSQTRNALTSALLQAAWLGSHRPAAQSVLPKSGALGE